jgi:hypothetical protein
MKMGKGASQMPKCLKSSAMVFFNLMGKYFGKVSCGNMPNILLHLFGVSCFVIVAKK